MVHIKGTYGNLALVEILVPSILSKIRVYYDYKFRKIQKQVLVNSLVHLKFYGMQLIK